MDYTNLMKEIEKMANVSHYRMDTHCGAVKYIILYDDHRTILNVIYHARKYGLVAPNVVFFDAHDDACHTDAPLRFLQTLGVKTIDEVNQRDFHSFVEFDLSYLDDNWLRAGMELAMINDAVVIGQRHNSNIIGGAEEWATRDGNVHRLHSISHLRFALSDRGVLGDTFTDCHSDYLEVREIFGYAPGQPGLNPSRPYILDFDLDCFTAEIKDMTIRWPERLFAEEYGGYKVQGFMQSLISQAEFITICREPGCCGGLGESNQILSYLDSYFFDNALGTAPIY